MSIQKYLNNILKDEELTTKDCQKIDEAQSKISSILQKKFPMVKIMPAGSKIKRTANRSGYDFDMLILFPKNYKSPREISEDVYNALKESNIICKKKKSILSL